MSKISESTGDGTMLLFNEKHLEEAMQPYLKLRYMIDESISRKRRRGFIIFAKNTDLDDIPFLPYTFYRWNDAKFVIRLIERKMPRMVAMRMFVRLFWKGKTDKRLPINMTKFEVTDLDNDARKVIWQNFKV